MPAAPNTVLVLGASGMLGNAAVRVLAQDAQCEVYGSVRSAGAIAHFPPPLQQRIVAGVDVNSDDLSAIIARLRPTVVVNCVGVVKQLAEANDPLIALPLNAELPHRLARLCEATGARLIQISTDCVFDGRRGGYSESDTPDATDLYGRSKLLGEVDYPNAVTLRTSLIGHELASHHGLLDWFLSQQHSIRGFTRAVFSGLTTVELVGVIARHVIPNEGLRGVYHLSGEPISKYELLSLVADIYGKAIEIVPCDEPVIDRTLKAERFRAATGYAPPDWKTLIRDLKAFYGREARLPDRAPGPSAAMTGQT